MVEIPKRFTEQVRPVEAFSFTDIATGKGYATFLAGMASGAAIIDHMPPFYQMSGAHILSTTPFYSEQIASRKLNALSTNINLEPFFDVKFTVPRIIEGVMLAEIPNAVDTNGNSSNTLRCWNEVDVIKWDGTTETSLVSGVTRTFDIDFETNKVLCLYLDIPRTNFKIGESLRIRVRQWVDSNETTATPAFALGHDPQNREGDDEQRTFTDGADASTTGQCFQTGRPTRMSFQVPFVIGA